MFDPLDSRQVIRIEAVHRGFLYQHLYAAACLLLAGRNGVRSTTMEVDEDVELALENGDRAYLQVKTRSAPLSMSDISGALERFDAIRQEHLEQRRPGNPVFVVVANVEPGPELLTLITTQGIPSGALVITPQFEGTIPGWLPPAWRNIVEAVAWCAEQAREISMTTLPPETLIWKLAGRAQLAAAGQAPGHTFQTTDLPSLFEQMVVQLQRFPEPPQIYRPLDNEPELSTRAQVRIVTGLSGSGKTAWAARAAMHLGGECAYYDVGDLPGPALAESLARELVAQWAPSNADGLRQILLTGHSGVGSIRALDNFLATHAVPALVVLDNAHRVSASDLSQLFAAASHLRFVLLAQPSPVVAQIEVTSAIQQETLQGWGLDQIAAEMHAQGARGSAADIARLQSLTGAMPLYVRSAAQLSATQYGGEIGALCDALSANENLVESAQEIILNRAFDALDESARDCVAILSLSDVPLTDREAFALVQSASALKRAGFVQAVRRLRNLGMLRLFGGQRLQIHDAFRVLGFRRLAELPPATATQARETLKELILESFKAHRDTSRFPLFIRTLVDLRELKTLVDIATEEFFHELGIDNGIWSVLEESCGDDRFDPEQRFYALDALVFNDMKHGANVQAAERIASMEELAGASNLPRHEQAVVAMKRMLVEARLGNEKEMRRSMARARAKMAKTPEHQRVLQYNIGHAMFELGRFAEAEAISKRVAQQYFELLGVSPETIFGLNQTELYAIVRRTTHQADDMKHLADALDMTARSANAQGFDSKLARVHAMKFYHLAQAIDSLVKVGQDLADEFIGRTDYVGAREMLEQHVLPVVIEYNMFGHLLHVRSQYAVVLGYCGEYDAADAELDLLDSYRPGLEPLQIDELNSQRELVAELRRLEVRPDFVIERATEWVRRFRLARTAGQRQ